jgi:hypothetical protein
VLVESGGKIAGLVCETELAGRVQARYCDLQQYSDRGEHAAETAAETAAGPISPSALLLSPQPYGHIERARRKLVMTSLPKRVVNDGTERA